MPRKKVKRTTKKLSAPEFKTQVDWQKHKLRPGSQRYNTMIKNRFGLSKHDPFESLTDTEKQTRREAEIHEIGTAKTYTDFANRQSAYRRAYEKVYRERDFIRGSTEERLKMMIDVEPELANALTANANSFDLRMTLLAYEDRERLINTGEYAIIRGKEYLENYEKAIAMSNMPVPKEIIKALKEIPEENILYFIDELLPQMPDWYGLNGSTLMPAIDFIQKLQTAVDFYNKQKGNN